MIATFSSGLNFSLVGSFRGVILLFILSNRSASSDPVLGKGANGPGDHGKEDPAKVGTHDGDASGIAFWRDEEASTLRWADEDEEAVALTRKEDEEAAALVRDEEASLEPRRNAASPAAESPWTAAGVIPGPVRDDEGSPIAGQGRYHTQHRGKRCDRRRYGSSQGKFLVHAAS